MDDFKSCSDEELVSIFKKGNDNAYNELYNRYAPKLKKLIYYYVLNPDDADDIFHEVNIKVFMHINSFNEKLQFSSWIYKIAINCSKNLLKSRKRADVIVEREKYRISDEKVGSDSPEEEHINKFEMQQFGKAVNGLKGKFKDVFVLRYDHKLKYKEIAEILACSERTAKWRMKKAIEEISFYLHNAGVV